MNLVSVSQKNTTTYIRVKMRVQRLIQSARSAVDWCCLIPAPDIISPLNQINAFNFPILILFFPLQLHERIELNYGSPTLV